jgi:class 3 adenylate cyclase/CHASE2 domain-containing sensor protein
VNTLEAERTADLKQSYRPRANNSIVLVTGSDETKSKLDLTPEGAIRRTNYAKLIRKLRQAGARTLILDVVFLGSKGADDEELRKAIFESDKLPVSVANINPIPETEFDDKEVDGIRWPYVDLGHLGLDTSGDLARAAANSTLGPEHVVIGAVPYRWDRFQKKWIQHIALSAVLQFHGISESEIRFDPARHELRVGGLEWSLQGNDALSIQWTEEQVPFARHDLGEVLADYSGDEMAAFRDKLVIVGLTVPGDIAPTVYGELYGVYVVAQIANTMLLSPSERLRDVPSALHYGWTFLFALLAFASTFGGRFLWTWFGLAALLTAAWFAPELIVRRSGVVFETVAPILAVLGGATLGIVVRLWIPRPMRAAGSEFEATAVFVDLKDSTRLLRELGPQEYRKLYTEFSEGVAAAVKRLGGHVERTTGDGALLLFPWGKQTRHSVLAARAIRPIRELAEQLGRNRSLTLAVTFGMEAGILTGGYVTEGQHRAWSSAGSAVNMAKRLQDATNELGADIAIGPVAARLMEGSVALRSLGRIKAQGFEEQVDVWTVALEREPISADAGKGPRAREET